MITNEQRDGGCFPYHSLHRKPNALARCKDDINRRKERAKRTTTPASSHLRLEQHGNAAQIDGVLGMVLAESFLRDLHCTTEQTFGILILALLSGRPCDAAKGAPWSIAMK